MTATTPGRQFLPAGLPRLAVGRGSPRILITSSWVIDSRWITSQRIPALGRRVVMTCSFSLQPDV